MSYASMELAKRSLARAKERTEPSLSLPLSDDLAEMLITRGKRRFSRPELAAFRHMLREALNLATGQAVK